MPDTIHTSTDHVGRWYKPVRWSDIVRSLLISGVIDDVALNTMKAVVRQRLKERIASGEVEQPKRGLYRLTRRPPEVRNDILQ